MPRILIIDDEAPIRRVLRDILENESYQVDDAATGMEALQHIKEQDFDAIFCDIKMPEMDGIEVLEAIKKESDVPVIMLSGHGTIETAVEAIKKGAFDFIPKPPDLNRLLITLRNALDKKNLATENKVLKKAVKIQHQMIGESEPMMAVKDMIEKVAPTNARVLITGENGTGKELVARQLHDLSARSSGPFIEVNCAAIPSELIESQLFGHEKGAFTSAIKQRKGDFELADGGTLFLDEIGDMSLSAQAKVLRALQENKITRVGSEKEIPVDVRILAATNKNLKTEIEKGNFREDLYHRLSVIVIQVPPLRERKDDIPLLVGNFLEIIAQDMGKPVPNLEPEAVEALKQYQSMLYVSQTPFYNWLKPTLERLHKEQVRDTNHLLLWIKEIDNSLHTLPTDVSEMTYDKGIDRYWFWRLDYYLWERKEELGLTEEEKQIIDEYVFRANRSIEHLHPQHQENNDEWDDEDIHSFGNLAMISQSFNSQQSDDPVTVKFARIMDQAHNHSLQSIKMYLMYLDAEKSPSGWKVDIKNSHQAKMFKILLESFAKEN